MRKDSTVLQVALARLLGYQWPAENDTGMELSEESRSWVQRSKELYPFADEDGIVCVSPVRGEESAMDRIIKLLAAAYGDEWSPAVLNELLTACDHAGKSRKAGCGTSSLPSTASFSSTALSSGRSGMASGTAFPLW